MNQQVDLLYSAEQVRELDRIAIEERGISGLTLMKRAAEACVLTLLEHWPAPGPIAVLCGSGNNAADGFIIAGLLAARGFDVRLCLIGREPQHPSDAAEAYEFALANGITAVSLEEALNGAGVIVDALLGTGASGEVRPHFKQAIQAANRTSLPILSVDLPSGLSADTGAQAGECIHASLTVTFIGRKLGLYTGDGPECAGDIYFADLDVPADVFRAVEASANCLDYGTEAGNLRRRHRNSHKGDNGHVLIVGGDTGMTGAAVMAAEAALFAGAGLVSVATRDPIAIVTRRPEIMARQVEDAGELRKLMTRASVVVLGPGLGIDDWGRALLAEALTGSLPLVVDADGLNLIAEMPLSRDDWILTPHPGEAARLLGEKAIQMNRPAAVRALIDKFGGTVLLKGAGTLIGSRDEMSLCPYGNPGMSVAGMGDVLSGVIAALVAQGLAPLQAARLGAVVHSLAADYLVDRQGERGLLATELLPEIRRLVNP